MNTKIKICGLKSLKDINIVNKYDVDYVGFIFANSKRKVTKECAREMRKALKSNIKAVGVFVNTPYYEINEIVKYASLDIVQLHGTESYDECEKIIAPVWKSISMKDKHSANNIENYKSVQGILLDGLKAGSGKKFNWNFATDVPKKHFTILAGGLTCENVKDAIDKVNPHVVDVSSGVELDNIKNEEKIKNFIGKVRENE